MIDPENLRTASLYINNQLLSRGLLRDGQNIDFADPEGSDGGLQINMGRIISVVNDLILRRDRDAEHRESLSSTLRTLRADYQRQTTEFGRQAERLSDTQRRVDTADATERALRTQLKTAEQGIYKLKEEMTKMKSLVTQTRSACANEVRKRDRQIDSLKKAVADAGRVRGGARNRDILTINITGEFGGEGDNGMGMPAGATQSEGYTLSMETNGFLTELAKGLSEENEGLLALVRRTVDGLRKMSGLDRDTGPGHEQSHNAHVHDELVMQPPQKSAEELAAELEAIVEHLRSILTNPSFVPIEEVEVRDEAIARLRAGLETMEARWKDAVHMIDGWRRRMVSSGKSVDMEDLQMGLRLSPVRVHDVAETANVEPVRLRLSCVQEEEEEVVEEEEVNRSRHLEIPPNPASRRLASRSPESLRLVPADDDDEDSDSDSSILQDDDLDIDDLDAEEPNVQILQISTASYSVDSSPLPEPPQISPLKDSYSSGNRGTGTTTHNNPAPYPKKPVGDFTTIVEENTRDLVVATPKPSSHKASPSQQKTIIKSLQQQEVDDDGDALSNYTASYDSPLFGKSGERPSRDRKLFSKQPPIQNISVEQRVKNATTGRNQGQSDKSAPSQPLTRARSTRSNTRKSNETSSPAPNQRVRQRLVVDTEVHPASNTPTPTSAVANSALFTSTSTPTSVTTRSRSKQQQAAAESAQRDTSAQSSSSTSSSSDPKQPRSTGRSLTRQPPASTSASSSSSRLPRRPNAPQQSPLNMATIAAKLAASEREADAARVRAKLRAVRRRGRRSGGTYQKDAEIPEEKEEEEKEEKSEMSIAEDMDPVKRSPPKRSPLKGRSPAKREPRRRWSRGDVSKDEVDELSLGSDNGAGDRSGYVVVKEIGSENGTEEEREEEDSMTLKVPKRTRRALRTATTSSKAASRRRSTLSPWELQGLITGNVGAVGSPAR
ncbi:Afadin and alpha-actinin-binding-domain-containing protein [Xylaria cubensis]|nr:Afadin and alpha-actinin-binding-domain-containing protein [Xylaria cubensis]